MSKRKSVTRKSQNPVSKKNKETDQNKNSIKNKEILNSIEPKTLGQQIYLEAIEKHPIVICDGPAGCGKTFISFGCALKAFLDEEVTRIIIVRPTIPSSDEPELGFLPGTLNEKMEPFLAPILKDSAPLLVKPNRLRGPDMFDSMSLISRFNIEVVPLHLMRGRSFHQSFIILDEAQNCTMADFKMFLTRIGRRSKVVIEGDATQKDRRDGALPELMGKLKGLDSVSLVKMTKDDILRNPIIAELIDRLN